MSASRAGGAEALLAFSLAAAEQRGLGSVGAVEISVGEGAGAGRLGPVAVPVPEARSREAVEGRRSRVASLLALQPAGLTLAIALAPLDLFAREFLDVGRPGLAEAGVVGAAGSGDPAVEAPAGAGVAVGPGRAQDGRGPEVRLGAGEEAVLDGFALAAEDGLGEGVGEGADPFAGEAEVVDRLLGETLSRAGRVEEGPFELVGVEDVG